MGARDVIQSIGDAVSGVDRNKTWLEGQELGARIGEQRSRTEEAMASARQKRIQAEIEEAKKQRDDQIAAMDAAQLADQEHAPLGTMIASGHGADYSGAMEGRNRAQQYSERQTVATPAPIGDVAAEASRQASLEALSPGSALAQRGGRGAPVVATDPDTGEPIYVTPKRATDEGMKPGARPSSSAKDPGALAKNIKALVDLGVDPEDAIERLTGAKANPESLYNAVLSAQLRNFVEPDKARTVARQMVKERFGSEAAAGAGGHKPLIKDDVGEEGLPAGIPAGSQLIGTQGTSKVYQTPDGRRLAVD